MKTMTAVLVLLASSLFAGCATHMIPGTEIDDNDDTRQILKVMEDYRKAVETKNAQAITDLADESFKDDGGSAALDDDLDYKGLYNVLPARLAQLEDIKLEIAVRKIEIDKMQGVAHATYTYSTSFKMPTLTKKGGSEAEIKQMNFKLATAGSTKVWKITSGI